MDYSERIKKFWDKEVKNFSNDDPSEYLLNFFSQIKKRKNRKILDLGCGAGRNTLMLCKLGFKVYGCDLNREMVLETRRKLPVHFKNNIIICDIVSLPYYDNFFDFVLSNGIFHNAVSFQDFEKAISETTRILKVRGSLVVNVFIMDPTLKGNLKVIPQSKKLYLTQEKLPMVLLSLEELISVFKKKKLYLQSYGTRKVEIATGERKVFKGVFKKRL